ncbi:MAG: NACHT domain-containing protein, partial [Solirubrobacterales bacterium]
MAWAIEMITQMLYQWPQRRKAAPNADGKRSAHNRNRMLGRVRESWIKGEPEKSKGVLEDSLEYLDGKDPIPLGLARWPEAVQHGQREPRQPDRDPEPLPAGTTVSKIFDEADGGLLILGPPGSGKTTALLELARDLLDRAENDSGQQMPVVFNLSSWKQHQPPLPFADWLVEELRHSYEVPRQIAKAWVHDGDILPLLDGLDEVAEAHQADCVKAIDEFRRTQYFGKLVVCSGTDEYKALHTRLQLEEAVVLQPLTREQVGYYLETVGDPLADVRAALRADESLWELLQSPLMLSVVTLAYRGRRANTLRVPGTLEDRRERLLAEYVELMFERGRPINGRYRYTQAQVRRWLSWLARSLRDHGQTEFDLDRLQPDWLPTATQRWLVILIPALLSWLVGGLLVGLVVGLIAWPVAGLVAGPLTGPLTGLVAGLLAGLVFALVAVGGGKPYVPGGRPRWPWIGLGLGSGVGFGLGFGPVPGLVVGLVTMGVGRAYTLVHGDVTAGARVAVTPVEELRWAWPALLVGLGFGSVFTLGARFIKPDSPPDPLINALVVGLVVGLAVGLVVGLLTTVVGRAYEPIRGDRVAGARSAIDPVEQLDWSWSTLRSRLRLGLGDGLGFGLRTGLRSGQIIGLLIGLLSVSSKPFSRVVGGLVVGLAVMFGVVLINALANGLAAAPVAELAEKRVTPNQGIHRSAVSGLGVGLGVWAVVWVFTVLVSVPAFGQSGLRDVRVGLIAGLRSGWVFGWRYGLVFGLVVGLVLALIYGG